MTHPISRRDALKVLGAASAGALVPGGPAAPREASTMAAGSTPSPPPTAPRHVAGDIHPLTSTSDVFVPPRGRAFMKFSFDFPEPSVAVGDFRFGFLVFTDENVYGLDASRLAAEVVDDELRLTATRFVWAGGQETAEGRLVAVFRRRDGAIEWETTVEMARPIKTVTTIVRDVPRGQIALAGGAFTDPRDDEVLGGYTFGAGDLHGPGAAAGMATPLAIVQAGDRDFVALSSLDDRVRPKRFYFQPGERAYRVELVYEHDAWRDDRRVVVPRWRIARAVTVDAAAAPHFAHVERAYRLASWETRTDVPAWMRRTALVVTLHGMHYTGFVFNDYARQLEILRWIATQIPGDRVLAFLSAWDGRYYWDYPSFRADRRMGGEAAFRRLIADGQRLGVTMMPMFTANAANRKLASWPALADAATRKIDGNVYDLDWVDWNNDRHQDGWLTYMNLGVASWRKHMTARIAECIERYGIDAYFLDVVGGHVNSTNGDMHEGTRQLVLELRRRHPNVACVGEMPYDALHEFIPMYHAGGGARWRKYARFFQHLSAPAPGRGSSGVHEAGFQRFDAETLSLSPTAIPTLQVVEDTFAQHRDTMAAIIRKARERAGA